MDPLVGRTLGPYELQSRLGAGGMGTVYRAVHRTLGRTRAIKVLPTNLAANATFVERFRREARLAALLEHPNIVPVHDVDERDGFIYIVMELLEGRTLFDVIRQDGALTLDRALHLLRQLAEALDYLHSRGVAHRDVKPANIFVRSDEHVTLVDFGIAHAAEEARLTGAGLLVGTVEYMAPEAIDWAASGPSTDQYALGIVGYELLTGRVPFTGTTQRDVMRAHVESPPPSPRMFRADVPVTVEQVLLRQLAKTPADRYPSAAAFVSELARAASKAELLEKANAALERDDLDEAEQLVTEYFLRQPDDVAVRALRLEVWRRRQARRTMQSTEVLEVRARRLGLTEAVDRSKSSASEAANIPGRDERVHRRQEHKVHVPVERSARIRAERSETEFGTTDTLQSTNPRGRCKDWGIPSKHRDGFRVSRQGLLRASAGALLILWFVLLLLPDSTTYPPDGKLSTKPEPTRAVPAALSPVPVIATAVPSPGAAVGSSPSPTVAPTW